MSNEEHLVRTPPANIERKLAALRKAGLK